MDSEVDENHILINSSVTTPEIIMDKENQCSSKSSFLYMIRTWLHHLISLLKQVILNLEYVAFSPTTRENQKVPAVS